MLTDFERGSHQKRSHDHYFGYAYSLAVLNRIPKELLKIIGELCPVGIFFKEHECHAIARWQACQEADFADEIVDCVHDWFKVRL